MLATILLMTLKKKQYLGALQFVFSSIYKCQRRKKESGKKKKLLIILSFQFLIREKV